MGSKRFVSAIEIGGSGIAFANAHISESRYGAPNFVEGRCGPPARQFWIWRGSFQDSLTRILSPGFSQVRPRVWEGDVALMYAAAAVSRTGFLLSSKTGRSASETSLS